MAEPQATILIVEDEDSFVEALVLTTIRGLGYKFESKPVAAPPPSPRPDPTARRASDGQAVEALRGRRRLLFTG